MRSSLRGGLAVLTLAGVVAVFVAACSPPAAAPPPTTTTTTTVVGPPTCNPASLSANTITIVPNPVVSTPNQNPINVDLCYNSAASVGKRTFAYECKKNPSDPTFAVFSDCSALTELTWNSSTSQTGEHQFQLFRGAEPSGDSLWGCVKAGDTLPAGYTAYTTCYVRFTDDTPGNNTDQLSVPFTFS
jgi:hypothetical protein